MVQDMIHLWKDKHKMSTEKTYQCWGIENLEQGTSAKGQDLQSPGTLRAEVFRRCSARNWLPKLLFSHLPWLWASFEREMLFSQVV